LFVCSFLSHFDSLIIDKYYLLLKCPVLLNHYTLGSHDYKTVRDADKSASFIPNIFWYSLTELDKIAQGNEKKTWYGLTGLRLIQVIRTNSCIRRQMVVNTVHTLFLIPKEVVTASFDYLLALGMIEQSDITNFDNKAVATYSVTKKCDIVERIIFNNPDTLFLLALDTPLLAEENRIKYKFENERFHGFLYSMISGYILMISYMIKQNNIEMKRLITMSKNGNRIASKCGINPEETFDLSKRIIMEPALCSIAGAYEAITKRNHNMSKLKLHLHNFEGNLTTFP
jgi:hypothetical protein